MVQTLAFFVIAICALRAQTTMLPSIVDTLANPVEPSAVYRYQLEQYLMSRIPALPPPTTPAQWNAEVSRLREHILNDVAYHGWPREWVNSPLRFEEAGVIETTYGYRIRKFRYEIVPGFFSTALLYEPDHIT
jgi:hypothetical protein